MAITVNRNEYTPSDLRLKFALLHTRKENTGREKVRTIAGSHKISKSTPIKA
jgi:hypothetical protein